MRFGPNTTLVEEVIEYARSGEFFTVSYQGGITGSIIEVDFVHAQELAWTQESIDGFTNWMYLQDKFAGELLRLEYTLKDFREASKELSKLVDELGAIAKARFSRSPFDDIGDQIATDLYYCAYKRAVIGSAPHFFEKLFDCYRMGGWPCGWKGTHPAGSVVVFSAN
ncbi:hypothetical protein GCM10007907_36990 [Chitinimonas prasina]|uniref:Uncharacterized protein n=1 Tax=Chitinimonas prasina TaxID=1434937 RepID=A0ABQ5YPS4_9NEIS|nr:hypothetical protein [Chitinimonas prasina]GLR14909.1 hypothetical protein GCM10007907_36990 [Chitinimonas prasina]